MMKVLFITHTYPPHIGGMQRQSYELVKGFSSRVEVCKLVYDSSKERKIFFFLNLRKRVRQLLEEHPDIDIIHLNDGLMAVFGLLIRSMTNLPIIVTIHGLDIVHPSKYFQKYIIKRFKSAYEGIIAVSHSTARECITRGFAEDNVHVVNNGVDSTIADIPLDGSFRYNLENRLGVSLRNKKIIVSIGRPVPRKGLSWFLKNVFTKLDNDVVYLIVGPRHKYIKLLSFLLRLIPKKLARSITLLFGLGLDEIVITDLLQDKDIKNRAFYISKVEFADLIQILKLSSLFIMPNRKIFGDIEGFGLVALEAALASVPVLCSAIDGITDAVIHNKNGLHIEAENKDEWINMIERLLLDKSFLEEFGEKARAFTLKHFSWEHMVDNYFTLFNKYAKDNIENTLCVKEADSEIAKKRGIKAFVKA